MGHLLSATSPGANLVSHSHQILFSLSQKPPYDKPPLTVLLLHLENQQAENLMVLLELLARRAPPAPMGSRGLLSHMLLILCTSPFVQSNSSDIRLP